MKYYNLNTPKLETDQSVIIMCISEYDVMKFHALRIETQLSIHPSREINFIINVNNIPAQGGQLITVFNLYIEVFTDENTFNEWKDDLKRKIQLIN